MPDARQPFNPSKNFTSRIYRWTTVLHFVMSVACLIAMLFGFFFDRKGWYFILLATFLSIDRTIKLARGLDPTEGNWTIAKKSTMREIAKLLIDKRP